MSVSVDTSAATDRLMRFLAVPGVTGEEAMIATEITATLREAGVPPKLIRFVLKDVLAALDAAD